MGTHWGVVHIMDFEGNENQKFQAHEAAVQDLSVDLDGEYIASASDDGKEQGKKEAAWMNALLIILSASCMFTNNALCR